MQTSLTTPPNIIPTTIELNQLSYANFDINPLHRTSFYFHTTTHHHPPTPTSHIRSKASPGWDYPRFHIRNQRPARPHVQHNNSAIIGNLDCPQIRPRCLCRQESAPQIAWPADRVLSVLSDRTSVGVPAYMSRVLLIPRWRMGGNVFGAGNRKSVEAAREGLTCSFMS